MGDIHNEIMACLLRIEDDLKVIRAQKSDFEAEMLEEYAQTQSISKTMAKKLALEDRRAKIEAAKQEAAQPTPTVQAHESTAPVPHAATDVDPPQEPKTIKVVFYDTTAAFRAEMKALTEKHGIRYGGAQ